MKILFILAPNVTVFEKKATLEISIGGSNAAGVIQSYTKDYLNKIMPGISDVQYYEQMFT